MLRSTTYLACGLLACVAAMAAAQAADVADRRLHVAQVLFGTTRLELTPDFLAALSASGVVVASRGPGAFQVDARRSYLAFPIPAGKIGVGDRPMNLSHRGGLELRAGDRTVRLSDLVIERRNEGTAVVASVAAEGHAPGRVTLFQVALDGALDVEAYGNDGRGRLIVDAAPLALSDDAAGWLNAVLDVDTFRPHMRVGAAHVTAYVTRGGVSSLDARG